MNADSVPILMESVARDAGLGPRQHRYESRRRVPKSVKIGTWSLSPDGLVVGEWLWEWADIAEVEIRDGKMRVACADGAPGATIEVGYEQSATVNAAVDLMRTYARTGRPPV